MLFKIIFIIIEYSPREGAGNPSISILPFRRSVYLPAPRAFVVNTINEFDLGKTTFRAVAVLSRLLYLTLIDIPDQFEFLRPGQFDTDNECYSGHDDQGNVEIQGRDRYTVVPKINGMYQRKFNSGIGDIDKRHPDADPRPPVIRFPDADGGYKCNEPLHPVDNGPRECVHADQY